MLSAGFAYFYNSENWLLYGLFGFFSTMAVYNAQRLFKIKAINQTPWLAWVEKNKRELLMLSMVCAIAATVVFFLLPNEPITFIILGVSMFISTFYVIRIKGTNMRQIPHLKIHLISFTWVAVVVLFPILNEWEAGLDIRSLFIVGGAHYLYVLAVTIPFDIRDLKYDAPEQKTIPQVIGVVPSKMLATFLLGVFALTMLYYVDTRLINNPTFLISVAIQIVLVIFMNEKRSDMYCAGLIDGSIALLGLSYFLV